MASFQIFTDDELLDLRLGGKILRTCLEETAARVKPGITTKELDLFAEEFITSHMGARPAFKGYRGYPATLCISVNEQVVHGIPGPRVLEPGDIVSLDGGVLYEGLYTDACITVPVGTLDRRTQTFVDVTKHALDHVVDIAHAGMQVGDISHAIQEVVEEAGYHCIPALTGHGLGRSLHQFPDVPNVGEALTGPEIPAGTILAIEPITSMGGSQIVEASDGWTLSTRDGSLSCHFEHTILFAQDGCEILA